MSTNQELRQASVRAVTGTAYTYEGDWHALFDLASVPPRTFDERLLAWINIQLGASYSNLSDAMAAFAASQGAGSWGAMGTWTPSGVTNALLLEDGTSFLLLEDGVSLLLLDP
jgi:hypothetical protein